MKRDLDTLKEALWAQFEIAAVRQANYADRSDANQYNPANLSIKGRAAMAQLAQAIVAVEAEQRTRSEAQNGITLPGKK